MYRSVRFDSYAFKGTGALVLALCLIVAANSHVKGQGGPFTYVYDELGRLVAAVDPNGETARYAYDAVGNLLSISRFNSSVVSILQFSPKNGPVGTPVIIQGTSFSTTGQNTITFNGVGATITSATSTQILTSVPAGATTGPIAITTPTGSATSSTPFTVGASTAPTITSFTPTIGTPGTALTITGTNFETAVSNDWVTINNRYALVNSATISEISTSVPNLATSGRVSVATPAGKAVSATDFFVPPTPFAAADVEVTSRMAFGESKTVTISAANKIGLILFEGTALQRASLRVNSFSMTNCKVAIYNPDGTALASTNFYATGGFLDTPVLPADGTYTILIDPQSTNTGSINFTLYNASDFTGTIVPGGSPVTVTTSTYGQNARLTFSAAANQRVSLKMTNVNLAGGQNWVDVSIKKPDGATLVSSTLAAPGGFIDIQVLPVAGTYTILVDPWGTSTGSTTLTLYAVPADVSGTITPGGSPVTVTNTVPGQNSQLSFSGSANDRVSVRVTGLNLTGGTHNWANLSIKKPDGATLVSSTLAAPGGFIDTQVLPVAGTYTILVDPRDTSIGSATLTLYTVPADVSGTITPGGSAVTVTTTIPGQNGQLSFSGSANQRVSLQVSGVNLTGGTYNWASVSIKKPDGSALVSSTLSGNTFFDTQVLLVAGTYTILFDPWDTSTGNLTLTLYDVPADVTVPITAGGSAVTVTTITPGQNASLTFGGTTNQRVSLNVTGVSVTGNNWVTVAIRKPDGTSLASMTSSGGFIDVKTLPVTGTYTVFVDPYTSNTGSVTLTLYDVPADVTGTITAGGSAVTVTSITPGQNASLTFGGTANQRVSLNVTGVSVTGNNWVTVAITKPDGTSLASTIMNSSGGFIDVKTLPVTGTYTVFVDPYTSNTGSVTLTLYDVPSDAAASTTVNGSAVGIANTVPGQNAHVTFGGTSGQQVTVRITNNMIGTVMVKLLKPDGTQQTSLVSSSSSFNLVTQTLTATGTFAVSIDPSGTSIGSVDVRVTSP